jgi:hypothetical protein
MVAEIVAARMSLSITRGTLAPLTSERVTVDVQIRVRCGADCDLPQRDRIHRATSTITHSITIDQSNAMFLQGHISIHCVPLAPEIMLDILPSYRVRKQLSTIYHGLVIIRPSVWRLFPRPHLKGKVH